MPVATAQRLLSSVLCAWKRGQPKLFEKLIMFLPRPGNRTFKLNQRFVRFGEINFGLRSRRADVAGNVQVVAFLGDLNVLFQPLSVEVSQE